MTKLYIEENTIENNVVPKLEQAIIKLNKSISGVGSLIIPNDFEYVEYLKHLLDNNYDILVILKERKEKIEQCIKKLKKAEKTNTEFYSEMKILDIPLRNSFVNKE